MHIAPFFKLFLIKFVLKLFENLAGHLYSHSSLTNLRAFVAGFAGECWSYDTGRMASLLTSPATNAREVVPAAVFFRCTSEMATHV
jgi:hypothetical protein